MQVPAFPLVNSAHRLLILFPCLVRPPVLSKPTNGDRQVEKSRKGRFIHRGCVGKRGQGSRDFPRFSFGAADSGARVQVQYRCFAQQPSQGRTLPRIVSLPSLPCKVLVAITSFPDCPQGLRAFPLLGIPGENLIWGSRLLIISQQSAQTSLRAHPLLQIGWFHKVQVSFWRALSPNRKLPSPAVRASLPACLSLRVLAARGGSLAAFAEMEFYTDGPS